MMRTLVSLSIPIALSLTPAARAQAPVDFSGRWTLDAPAIATTPAVPGTPAAAAAPGDMGSGWGSVLTITQDAKSLAVEYVFFSRYDLQPPLRFTYPLDGSEARNTVMLGRGEQVESSKGTWNGATLILTSTSRVDERRADKPFTVEVTRRLSLESPTTMIVDVTRSGVLGGAPTTTRSIYRKE